MNIANLQKGDKIAVKATVVRVEQFEDELSLLVHFDGWRAEQSFVLRSDLINNIRDWTD